MCPAGVGRSTATSKAGDDCAFTLPPPETCRDGGEQNSPEGAARLVAYALCRTHSQVAAAAKKRVGAMIQPAWSGIAQCPTAHCTNRHFAATSIQARPRNQHSPRVRRTTERCDRVVMAAVCTLAAAPAPRCLAVATRPLPERQPPTANGDPHSGAERLELF